MIELLQILDVIVNGNLHLLWLFLVLFVLIPIISVRIRSKKYKPFLGNSSRCSVIVPVYLEDPEKLDQCLNSIDSQNPSEIIVVFDGANDKLEKIAAKYTSNIIVQEHSGKRKALVAGWKKASNEIVVMSDSDVIHYSNTLEMITKPFLDTNIAGVAARQNILSGKSKMSYAMHRLIGMSHNINCSALNGNLVVVDGKCGAWRRDFLLSISDDFINETWFGKKCMIGDDRYISREALKHGYKTVYQSEALIDVYSEDTFIGFINQQIRWRRSGTKFWIKDLFDRPKTGLLYSVKCATYYASPVIFTLVVAYDCLFTKFGMELYPYYFTPLVIILGTIIMTFVRQMIYFNRIVDVLLLPVQAVCGLFVMFPISLYAIFTIFDQGNWMNRNGNNKSGINFSLMSLFLLVLFIAVSPLLWYAGCDWWDYF